MLNNLIEYVSRKVDDSTAATSIAIDVYLDKNAKGREFRCAKFKVGNYFDKNRNYRDELTGSDRKVSAHLYEPIGEDDRLLIDTISYENTSEKRIALLEEQRQLIRNLVSNSDELTTAIVNSWLKLEKPNYSEVAKLLGVNRMTVQRRISSLEKYFDEKQYGNFRDYFSA